MEKLINAENLRNFAYTNAAICMRPIRGIVLSFFGLGGADMYFEETREGKFFAEKGILYIVPYTDPWAWMNPQSVQYTDEILDVVMAHEHLPADLPIVSTGGSMGGLAALVYTQKAKRMPVACVANCPVCDLPFHLTERPDLPRTLYSAFFHEDGTLEDALRRHSPLHLVDQMPKVDYFIFHCGQDQAVQKERHSDRLVQAMTPEFSVTYHVVPDRGHCDLTPPMWELYFQYMCEAIEKHPAAV